MPIPIGCLCELGPIEDGQGLSQELKPTFIELCDTQIDKFRHGRVLLAAHVIALFRVDREWATQHLLPLFDWHRSEAEARAAWEGFLWSPRLYRALMEVLKPAFLDTARHFAALGKHDGQYASLLTFAALDPGDTFTTAELAAATRALPPDGLHEAAQALVRALEGAGDRRADYWTNRVIPYLHAIWPKTRDNIHPPSPKASAACASRHRMRSRRHWCYSGHGCNRQPTRTIWCVGYTRQVSAAGFRNRRWTS
jgi:hypothetical protein